MLVGWNGSTTTAGNEIKISYYHFKVIETSIGALSVVDLVSVTQLSPRKHPPTVNILFNQ